MIPPICMFHEHTPYNWTWLFGDKTNKKFKTCWLAEKDNFGYLTCADKYNGNTSVIYQPLDENYKPIWNASR
jgi:hypothetical protein